MPTLGYKPQRQSGRLLWAVSNSVAYNATVKAGGGFACSDISFVLPLVAARSLLLLLASATILLLTSALAPPLTLLLASGDCGSSKIMSSMASYPHLLLDQFA